MEGSKDILEKNNIKGDALKQYLKDSDTLSGEPKENKIQDWLKAEGSKKADELILNSLYSANNDYNKKYVGGKNYSQYIRLHTGEATIGMNAAEKKEYLAKAIAASFLKTRTKSFSVKTIHQYAENIKKLSGFKAITSDPFKVDKYLAGEHSIEFAKQETLQNLYRPNPDNAEKLINAMKKLHKNMMSSEKRSDEYKALYKSVENFTKLSDKYDLSQEADRIAASNEMIDMSTDVLNSVIIYTKGKESIRTTTGGKERFNNSMDALGVLVKYIPNFKNEADAITRRINTSRKAEAGQENYIDVTKYGEKRAEDAKIARQAKEDAKNAAKAKPAPIKNS